MPPYPLQASAVPSDPIFQRQNGFLIALHWTTAVLVLIVFILGPGGSELRVYSAARDFERSWHEVLGLTILVLTLVRVAWRLKLGKMLSEKSPAPWMDKLARFVRFSLYLLLVITPLTAVLGAWLEGHPLTLGMLGEIPPLIPEDHPAGARLADLHGYLGDAVIWLAGFHAAAALFHHFVLKDSVLVAMLPKVLSPPGRR